MVASCFSFKLLFSCSTAFSNLCFTHGCAPACSEADGLFVVLWSLGPPYFSKAINDAPSRSLGKVQPFITLRSRLLEFLLGFDRASLVPASEKSRLLNV